MDDVTASLNQRQSLIVQRVTEQGFVTIDALARDLDVSAQTVRREIIRLDEAGLIERFHGGAGKRQQAERQSYQAKQTQQADIKRRIGAAMAAQLRDGQCVFLDVGTTVEAVAQAITVRRDLTVVTVSLAAARIAHALGGHRVVVSGGTIGGPDGSLIGPHARAVVDSYRYDCAVIACSGIDADATVLDFDADKVALKQLALARARTSALVVDSSKILRPARLAIAPLTVFPLMITDEPLPAALAMQAPDTHVLIA